MSQSMVNGTVDVEMKDEEPTIEIPQVATDTSAAASTETAQSTIEEAPSSIGQVVPEPTIPTVSGPGATTGTRQNTPSATARAVSAVPSATGKEKENLSSAARGSRPPTPSARPDKPAAHGSKTRLYLNQNITPHLLEGMKLVATHEPENPLKWLGEFLIKRSHDTESLN